MTPPLGPARIVECPPAPETARRYWEVRCDDCGTHEGTFPDPDDPRLVQIRDEHNEHHVMLNGRLVRITDPAVDYGATVRPLAGWAGDTR